MLLHHAAPVCTSPPVGFACRAHWETALLPAQDCTSQCCSTLQAVLACAHHQRADYQIRTCRQRQAAQCWACRHACLLRTRHQLVTATLNSPHFCSGGPVPSHARLQTAPPPASCSPGSCRRGAWQSRVAAQPSAGSPCTHPPQSAGRHRVQLSTAQSLTG